MMDYYGFWQGIIILFGVLPVVVGAILGVLWAWQTGQRGTKLIAPAFLVGRCHIGTIGVCTLRRSRCVRQSPVSAATSNGGCHMTHVAAVLARFQSVV